VHLFHVSSSRNRSSILEHGLDWSKMGDVRGIAGSIHPEEEGCFLCRDRQEADWFVAMNNTGGPVDIWVVDSVDTSKLVDAGSGYYFLPGVIARDRITLAEQDLPGATMGR
jgi:hypothetical protein